MAREMIALLATTGGMLESLFGLACTAVGAFVIVRWVWRKALSQASSDEAEQRSGGDGA